ncbi:MAG: hypothetical protein J4G04_06650 [Nitrosopumilaceae archaeon]|nr:hypothetical protein [Nitrosopumilaceae archaeon]
MADGTRSMTDVLKDSTSKVMKTIDAQVPLYVRMNSSIYREHNRLAESLLEAGYSLERMGIGVPLGQEVRWAADMGIQLYAKTMMAQAEMYGEFLKWYPQVYVSALRSFDQAMKNWVHMAYPETGRTRPKTTG